MSICHSILFLYIVNWLTENAYSHTHTHTHLPQRAQLYPHIRIATTTYISIYMCTCVSASQCFILLNSFHYIVMGKSTNNNKNSATFSISACNNVSISDCIAASVIRISNVIIILVITITIIINAISVTVCQASTIICVFIQNLNGS